MYLKEAIKIFLLSKYIDVQGKIEKDPIKKPTRKQNKSELVSRSILLTMEICQQILENLDQAFIAVDILHDNF